MSARLFRAGYEESAEELLPVLTWGQEQPEGAAITREALEEWMPGYLYQTQTGQVAVRQPEGEFSEETQLTLEELMRMENQEQNLQEPDTVVMLDMDSLLAENGWDAEEEISESGSGNSEDDSPEVDTLGSLALNPENGGFVPHIRQQTVDLTALQDYETLRDRYYAVDSVTNIGRDLIPVQINNHLNLGIFLQQTGNLRQRTGIGVISRLLVINALMMQYLIPILPFQNIRQMLAYPHYSGGIVPWHRIDKAFL